MAGENKEMEVKLAHLEADNKKLREEKEADLLKLREENKLKDQRLADLERRNLLAEIDRGLVKLRDEGKLTPAEINAGLGVFMAALPDGEIQMGDKKTTLRAWLMDFLGNRKAVITLGSLVNPGTSDEPGKGIRADIMPKHLTKKEEAAIDPNRAELASRAKEIELREKKLNPRFTYMEALVLAEKENPHLVER